MYSIWLRNIATLLLLALVIAQDDSCVSIGNSGKLCGKVESVLGKDIVTYFSVPFAKPPVGELRFMPPRSLEPLSNKVNAFELSPACPQGRDDTFPNFWGSNMWNPNTEVSEDCLYLNIWAPKNAKGLPVMVWIFGGGFYSGSPSLAVYEASAMAAKKDVVVVNVNYRVGLFGFGYLNSTSMPGNMGLLDQRLAMQWVADNIASLGGDPAAVTIFGESAGAASVSAHVLAPGSQALFQAAIMQSGSVLAPWAMDSPRRATDKTAGIAAAVGCEPNHADELIKCLKEKPMQEIVDASFGWKGLRFMEFPSVPVSEDPNFFGAGTSAHKLLAEGDFSAKKYLMGVMADEAAFFILYFLPAYFNRDKPWKLSRSQFIKATRESHTGVGGDLSVDEIYQNAAMFQYEQSSYDTYANSIDELIGDEQFVCSVMDFSRGLAKNSEDVRLYYFNHTVSTNPWPRDMGVLHGYEIELVFGLPFINDTYTYLEKDFAKRLLNIWTGVRTGDGKVFKKWPAVSANPEEANSVKVLQTPVEGDIDEFLTDFKTNECKFWKNFKTSAKCPRTAG